MNIGKLSVVVSAPVLGAAAFVTALGLDVTQKYDDFIVGHITWYAGNKLQDLVAWPAFILAYFLGSIALSRIVLAWQERFGAAVSTRLANQLILWSIPFYATVGALFLGGALDKKLMTMSVLGIVFIATNALLTDKTRHEPDPELFGITLLSILLISLFPIEIALLMGRAPAGLIGDVDIGIFKKTGYLLLGLGLIGGVFALANHRERLRNNLPRIILLSQVGLPIFFLTLYPARLLQPSGALIKYDTTVYLKIFVVGLVALGLYDVINRYRINSKGKDWKRLFSPFALFGLLVAIKAGNTIAPQISPDDYHFGENLLGWWSYMAGAVPYVGYIPAHGIIENDLGSLLSFLFYDGSAASRTDVNRMTFAILGFAAFISIYYFSSSIVLAFTLVLLLEGRLAWLFFVPFICLWLSPSLRASPARWLFVWMLTSPIVILGIPPQGLLLVAASSVIAAKSFLDILRFVNKRSVIYVGSALSLLLVLFLATPLLTMLVAAIRYVVENGPINQLAYGLPWSLTWSGGEKSRFVFEAIRMSWVAVALACLYLIHDKWREFRDAQSPLYPAVVFLIFSLLMIPYSMGRIDPSTVSRPGLASIFSWVVMFPLLVWGFLQISARPVMLLIVAFASSLLGMSSISYSALISSASAKIPTAPLKDAAEGGLPNVGKAHIEEAHWDRIARLDALLKSRLGPDETYLDLTSRNAHYFYVNRRPVMAITAPYNLVPLAQQKRAVQSLGNLPRVALLQADNIVHDGGGLALRNPYLYRFVINNYVPRFEKGFIVGYRRADQSDTPDTEITAVEVKDISDDKWTRGISRHGAAVLLSDPLLVSMLRTGDRVRVGNGEPREINKVSVKDGAVWLDGVHLSVSGSEHPGKVDVITSPQVVREYRASLFHAAFSVSDYRQIPVAWGRSWSSLRDRMIAVRTLDGVTPSVHHLSPEDGIFKVNGVDPQLNFDISNLELAGRDGGLLRFDFTCAGRSAAPRLQVFWWGDERDGPFESSSVKFSAESGTLIVPLDASPWWLGLDRIKGIRIDLDNATACREFSVEKIGIYQRVF